MPVTKVKSKWSSGNLVFTKTDGTVIMTIDGTNRDINIPTGATLTVVDGIAGTTTYGLVGVMAAAGTGEANTVGVEASASRTDHVHALGAHDHSGATKGGNIGAATVASITLTGDIDLQTSGTGTYDLILKDAVADALSIRRAATDVIVFDTTTPQVTITPNTVVTGTVTSTGDFVVGANKVVVTAATGATTFAQAVTVSAGGVAITGDSTITGALTVSGALNWGGVTVIGNSLTVDELILDTDGAQQAVTVCYLYRDGTGSTHVNAIAGQFVSLDIANTAELKVGDALIVINEASNDRDFRVESGGLQYALYVDGGKDAVVIGGNTDVSDADTSLRVSTLAKTATNNENFAILWVQPVGATTMQGTNAIMASVYVKEPDLTDPGAGSATEAATVYIADAPTEGDANYALMVKSGAVTIAAGALTVEGGAFVFNSAKADLNFTVASDNLAYALYVDAGKDCVVIGDNTDKSDVDVRLWVGNVAKTLLANESASIVWVAPTATTTTAGGASVHPIVSSAYFKEPDVTIGVGTVTVAATVYIADAPTEGVTNAALYVASGATELQALGVAGAATFNEASADVDFRVESNGLQYALYVDGGKNAVEIGGDTDVTDADTSLRISTVAKTITNAENFAILWVAPVGSTTFDGVNAIVASAYFKEPDLTDPGAGGSATVAATVYIADAPTEGDANAALYVASGATVLQAVTTGAITVTGGQKIISSSATEIGISVTNDALTVGSEGSMVVPYISQIAAAFSDAIGGDVNGCIGINYDSDTGPTTTLEARVEGSWLSVALAGIEIQGKTVGGGKKRGELWHDKQLLGNGFVDETVCAKCGKQMKVGEKLTLFANYERKSQDGARNLHAVFCHADC